MKKLIVITFLFITSVFSFSQGTYKSFIHDGYTKWLYSSTQDECNQDEIIAYGDTIINNLKFKKCWTSSLSNSVTWDSTFNADVYNQNWRENTKLAYEMGGYLRQTDDSSKLYLYNSHDNKEYLIADMNLEVGDTLNFPVFDAGCERFEVKSTYSQNGLKIIEFDNSPIYGLKIIEGIGPTLLFTRNIESHGTYDTQLKCYSNYLDFYNNSFTSLCGCYKTVDVKEVTEKMNNRIYPNPATDHIAIKNTQGNSMGIKIIDITGRTLKQMTTNNTETTINLEGYPTGLYTVRVNGETYKLMVR